MRPAIFDTIDFRPKNPEYRSARLLLVVLLLIATGLSLTGYRFISDDARLYRAQMEREVETVTYSKLSQLVNWHRERLGDAGILYRNPVFSRLVERALAPGGDSQAQAELQAWFDRYQAYQQYDRVSLLDAAGVERLAAPGMLAAAPSAVQQAAAEVLRTGDIAFVDFFEDATLGSARLAIAVPILAEPAHDVAMGVVVLRMDPALYLDPLLRQWPFPGLNGEILLARREADAAVVLNSRTGPLTHIPLTAADSTVVQAVLGRQGIFTGAGADGVAMIADAHPLPDTPWVLMMQFDAVQGNAPLLYRRLQIIALFAAAMLVSSTGLALIWRQQRVRYYRAQAQAAQALRTSEERFRLAFTISPDALSIARLADGRFLAINQGFTRMLGFEEADAIGRSSLDLPLWPDPAERVKAVRLLQETGMVTGYETIFLTKTGEPRQIMLSAVMIELNGEPYILNTAHDIGESKRVEAELRRQNAYLTALQETTLDLLAQLDLDTLLGKIVARAAQLLGASAGFLDLVNPAGGQLEPRIGLGALAESTKHPTRRGEGLAGIIWRTGQPLIVEDYDRWPQRTATYAHGVIGSLIGAPLLADGQVSGVLGLAHEAATPWRFRPEDADILSQFARLATIAIGNARLFEAARQELAERKQAEEALRASEARYRELFISNPHPMWVYDLDTLAFLAVNDAAVAHYGYSRDEFLAMTIAEIRPAADAPQLLTNVALAAQSHEEYTRSSFWRHLKKDGSLIEVEIASHPLEFEGRRARMVLAYDMTERNRAEAQLLAAQDELKRLLGSADRTRQALLSVVEDQKQVEAALRESNQRIQRQADELAVIYEAARRLQRLFRPNELAQELIDLLEETLHYEFGAILLVDEANRTLRPFALSDQGQDVDFIARDKIYIAAHDLTVDVGICGYVARTGETVRLGDVQADPRYYGMRADIRSELCAPLRVGDRIIGVLNVETPRPNAYTESDQRVLETIAAQVALAIEQAQLHEQIQRHAVELEQRVAARTTQLQAANQELEAFSYSVSHDLRAPLRALDGFSAELLAHSGNQLDAQGRHYLDRIQGASRRMGQLIAGLLDLSRVTRRDLVRQSVDLSALASELATELQREEPARQAEFIIEPGLVVAGDVHLLRLVLQNLLGNAWKFSSGRTQTHIELGARPQDDEMVYFVRDNGVGFDMAYADKLFAPFQRLHSQAEFPGAGIGLATVQRIIRRHGGRIWVEAAVDQGAVFYFTAGNLP